MKQAVIFVALALVPSFVAQAEESVINVDAKEIFLTNCAPCHGNSGNGKGPAAGSLDPKPRNFKQGLKKFKYGSSLEEVVKTVTEGVEDTAMPPWSEALNAGEIEAVSKYVRSLAGAKS